METGTFLSRPGRSFSVRQETVEDIVFFQWQLDSIGDTRHVVTVARPPEHVYCSIRTELGREVLELLLRHSRRLQLAREGESSLLLRAEARPVALRQASRPLGDRFLIQARDREQHFTMAHSVERSLRARHHPEQA